MNAATVCIAVTIACAFGPMAVRAESTWLP